VIFIVDAGETWVSSRSFGGSGEKFHGTWLSDGVTLLR